MSRNRGHVALLIVLARTKVIDRRDVREAHVVAPGELAAQVPCDVAGRAGDEDRLHVGQAASASGSRFSRSGGSGQSSTALIMRISAASMMRMVPSALTVAKSADEDRLRHRRELAQLVEDLAGVVERDLPAFEELQVRQVHVGGAGAKCGFHARGHVLARHRARVRRDGKDQRDLLVAGP